jgi:acyl phosphate:glycerol-3-phosphate acyltransferase
MAHPMPILPVALVVGAYLVGSIPFSFIVAKLFAGMDIRAHGSGNVGATNVLRNAGKLAGILALTLDLGKGYAAVLGARLLVSRPEWPFVGDLHGGPLHSPAFWIALAGLLAMIGHMFPIWLGFRGGKGVATAAGVFLAIDPLATAGGVIIFLLAALVTRYVSVGSMAAAAAMPLLLRFATHAPFWTVVISILISFSVILKHHTNIARLAGGSERQLGDRSSRKDDDE